VRKVSVLERMVEVISRVVRAIVPVPLIMVDVLPTVHFPVLVAVLFCFDVALTPSRRRGHLPLVCARPIFLVRRRLRLLLVTFIRVLRNDYRGHRKQKDNQWQSKTLVHPGSSKEMKYVSTTNCLS
jgi:hypothetical protein